MAAIVPTITTADPATFLKNIQAFQAFSKRVQVDMSDGTFAANVMVPLASMKFPEGAQVDIHLMTAKPSQYLQNLVALKPSLCILHAEIDDNIVAIVNQLRAAGIKIGVALLKGTFPGRVKELIAMSDHVMIFAGNLGEQGGTADYLQIEKVPLIRAIKPNVEIGWDGGANLTNIRALAHGGLDVINVGSAITRASDPNAMYQSLMAESEKKGVLV